MCTKKLYMKHFINTAVILLFMTVLIQGCNGNKPVSSVTKVQDTVTLSFSEINLSKDLLAPTRMLVSESRLVIYQRKGDTLFTVLPEPMSGECYSAGLKGRSSNEFIGIDVQSLSACEDGFRCVDSDGKIKQVSIADNGLKVVSATEMDMSDFPQNGILLSF